MRDLSTIRAEIEQVRPLARAEAAYRAAAGKGAPNPWTGSAERLAALERELDELQLRSEGEQLALAMGALAEIEAEEHSATEAARRAADELTDREHHPVIARWKAAPEHAMRLAVLQRWEQYAAWVTSSRSRSQRSMNELAPQAWPSGVRGQQPFVWPRDLDFDADADREALRAWLLARERAQRLGREAQGISAKRASIFAQYPVLRGAELPKRARSAA